MSFKFIQHRLYSMKGDSLESVILLAENPAGCFGPPPDISQNAPLLNLLVPQKNLLLITTTVGKAESL
jgi:hypothetical protein